MTNLDKAVNVQALTHDGNITYAHATNRMSTKWVNQEMLWSEFIKKLSKTVKTKESISEYNKMSKSEQSEIKDVGGFVGGFLKGGRRKADSVMNRSMLTLDIDYGVEDMDDVISMLFDYAYCVYSTHKHRPEKPRIRLVIPLKRHVDSEEYAAVSMKVAESIGIDYFDDTTYQPHRLMYWPSTSDDAEFYFNYQDAEFLNPDDVLAEYHNWRDPLEWPTSSRREQSYKRMADKQGDPHDKPGIVGAFCKAYDIHDVISEFLSDVYEKFDDNRYTYLDGSAAGGLVLYDDGKFAYSHHGTDPVSSKLVNSFDLLRIHKFGAQDEDAKVDTPVNRLPSYKSMKQLAQQDDHVKAFIIEEKITTAQDDFDFIETDETASDTTDKKWSSKLTLTKEGAIEVTVPNIMLIMNNDPHLKGKIAMNEFNGRLTIMGQTPWRREKKPGNWTDNDDSGLRNYIERYYDVYNKIKTDDAIRNVSQMNSFHPIRDYLDPLEWDGVERLDTLFHRYLGSENNDINRAVTRKSFTAAIARVYEPGIKYDYMLTLYGPQGVGKSALIARMGGEWFSDSVTSVTGKESYEALQGAWIIEMGELAATKKAEVESIKHFISKQVDSFRVAYGRHKEDFPRQCVFFGTTNKIDFLRDDTGGRRFWPITVKPEQASTHWSKLKKAEIDQLWAEAKHYYEAGEPLFLEKSLEKEMNEIQAAHTEESPYEGVIREYLDTKIPKNWAEMDIGARRTFLSDEEFDVIGDVSDELVERDRVCALEVWCECLGNDKNRFPRMEQREINAILKKQKDWKPYDGNKRGCLKFGKYYGVQKAFTRDYDLI